MKNDVRLRRTPAIGLRKPGISRIVFCRAEPPLVPDRICCSTRMLWPRRAVLRTTQRNKMQRRALLLIRLFSGLVRACQTTGKASECGEFGMVRSLPR